MKPSAPRRPLPAMPGALRLLVAVALGALLGAPSPASAGNTLYASNWTQGAVSAFSIGAGGLLAQQGTGITSTGSQPAGVAISANGQDLYVANENQGTVSTYSIGAGGALTQVGAPVSSGNSSSSLKAQPYGVAVSPSGQNLYVANYLQGTISTFAVAAGGALTQQGTGITSGSSGPSWLAVSPNGQNLYVTNYSAGTVSTFSIGTGGVLTPQGSPVITGSGTGSAPENVVISPNGEDLYVANHADGTVSTFAIGAGGALSLQGSPVVSGGSVASGPEGVAISPNGQDLYVTNKNTGTVSTFALGTGGVLAPQASTATSAQPFGLAVSPDGHELYVASFVLGTVSMFAIGSDGALTAQGTPVLSGSSSSSGAYELVVSPDQGPSAAYSATVSPTAPVGAFNGRASTAGSAPISTYAWQFGDGAAAIGGQVNHTFAAPGAYRVTLTLIDADSCSTFGPFTGQSGFCAADPGASTSQTVTVPARPRASHESLTGLARRKPKLSFTVTTGALAPPVTTIAVSLPRGLRFSGRPRSLARHVTVADVKGTRQRFAVKIRHRVLTITLMRPPANARVTVASPALSADKRLANAVKAARSRRGHKRHKPVHLTFKLELTDSGHNLIRLLVKTPAR